MNVLDANVLVALFRLDHEHHRAATRWWQEAVRKGSAVTVPDIVWVAFLRLTTSRRIFAVPASFGEAWSFLESMTQQGIYVGYAADPRIMAEMGRLGADVRAVGNLVTDVYIAASARMLGATVVTFDRDFRKFDGVRIVEPA